ncbi:MipA/OmpV family protein [Psychromonas sp. MME2]|uniref:MipA/OmpV family protein n=1 Tax=unclassified Psychromonas TaxID=2614957 RepID=UPI00339C94C0
MKMKYTVIAALVASLPMVAQAESNLEIGAGAAFKNTAYRNYDDNAQVMPLISFDYEWFYAQAGEFGFKPYDDGTNRIGTFISMGQEEWQRSDNNNDSFKGFENKDRAINIGVSYRHKATWGVISASIYTDVNDTYGGKGGTLGYAYPWVINQKFAVVPSVKVKFMDSDYANYYYGISNKDAQKTGINSYDTGSATNIEVGVMSSYLIADHWKLYAGVNYTKLDSDIKDSPLLSDDKETVAIIGAAYKF